MSAAPPPATTGDLIEFVLRRLAEDQQAADKARARLATDVYAALLVESTWTAIGRPPAVSMHPVRALADIQARRSMILMARAQLEHGTNMQTVNAWRDVARHLAYPYRHHADYQPGWEPNLHWQ